MGSLERHVAACDNAILPGARRPFSIGPHPVGWVLPRLAERLGGFSPITVTADGVTLAPDAAADLPRINRILAGEGLMRWRDEFFDVRADPDGPTLAQIDRGALPSFGIAAVGAHVNGLVRARGGLHLWVAFRSRTKLLDPGKLDHIAAGGVASGGTPFETMVRESEEEAGIPEALASTAREVSRLSYCMERAEGLRRDMLVCYDLDLPPDFAPNPTDGEVERFELWPMDRVFAAVRDTDDFKFNVNLVLIDLFRRLAMA